MKGNDLGKTLGLIVEIGSIAALSVVTAGVGAGLAAGWTLGASVAAVGGTLGIGAAGLIGVASLGIESISALLRKTPGCVTRGLEIRSGRNR
jgi:hypothetical protein